MVHLREWRQILFNFIREIRDQNNRGIVVEFSRVGLKQQHHFILPNPTPFASL